MPLSTFENIYLWLRSQPILYRFTLGTRILLALAFLPTGLVKLMGRRFATGLDQAEGGAGEFFEILYSSGLYWQFLGLGQMVAGLLILWHRTSAAGSVLFLAIISNIFFITISYNFSGTWMISSLMLLASLWLCMWEWDRIRYMFDFGNKNSYAIPELSLKGGLEKIIYITGFMSGLLLFMMMRGFFVSENLMKSCFGITIFCFITAIMLGIKYRKSII